MLSVRRAIRCKCSGPYRCDVALCNFSRYDCGACFRNTLSRFSWSSSFRDTSFLFFLGGEQSSKPTSEVRSTRGAFLFGTEISAAFTSLLRFFVTFSMGDDSSAGRLGDTSAVAWVFIFHGVVVVDLDLVRYIEGMTAVEVACDSSKLVYGKSYCRF